MSALRKLASQTAVYGIPTILGRFLNYLLVPLYTDIFIPEEYGVVTTLYAMVAFFNVLLTFGMETTFFRFASRDNDWKQIYSNALNSVAIVSLLFLGITLLNTESIADFLKEPQHPEYVVMFAFVLFFDAISSLPLAKLRQQGRAKRFAINRSLNIFSNIFFNLFFLWACPLLLEEGHTGIRTIYDPELGVGYIFIANLLSSTLVFALLLPEMKELKFGISPQLWRWMMKYSIPLLFVGFAGIVNETFDRVLLQYLLPPDTAKHDVGVYGACYKLSILMSLFIQAFRFAAEPFFFAQSREAAAPATYAKVTSYFALFCFIIFLVVSIYLDIFKLFLRNKAYYEGLDVVPILLLANLFLGIYYNLSIWYKVADRTNIGAWIAAGGAILTILLNILLIPAMSPGYMGSAWTTLFVYGGMTVTAYFLGQKYYPVPYETRKFVLYLCFALLLFLLGRMTDKIDGAIVRNTLKALLIMCFVAVAWVTEKPKKVLPSQQ